MGPLEPRHLVGRIFGTDWTVANVAKLLKFNAARGMVRSGPATGGRLVIQANYLRTVSARHLPSGAVVTFTCEEEGNFWHAAICFADLNQYLPWNAAAAEEWLAALFGADRPRLQESVEAGGVVHHFKLPA
uniref:Uncharacterized protein n=1 Tax=Solibacter usitatus (strain Ellin6076) TaxID=234267 RepID=Q01NY4_SOLUE